MTGPMFQTVLRLSIPELVLLASACFFFLGALFKLNRRYWGTLALLTLAGALVSHCTLVKTTLEPAQFESFLHTSPIYVDNLAWWVKLLGCCSGFLLVCALWHEVEDEHAAEHFGCVLLLSAGVCLVGSANELVTLFLALELVSIPTYVLLYLGLPSLEKQEALLKYFLLSVFSSALLLFGMSYLYGLSGTTNLPALTSAMSTAAGQARLPAVAIITLVLVIAGLGFRITAVPFHFYAPDVYQGVGHANASLLAYVPKIVGFSALLRLLGYVPALDVGLPIGYALGAQSPSFLLILAAVTMTMGNILGLLQEHVRRLLAYSSVAHAGYMLMGLAAAPFLAKSSNPPTTGVDAILFYLVAYGAMTLGLFALLSVLRVAGRPIERVDDLAGLGKTQPLLAGLITLFLLSMIGMPLTAGFVGKLLLILGSLAVPSSFSEAPLFRGLAVIAAVNAAIGAWYYLRLIAHMFLRPAQKPIDAPTLQPAYLAVGLCAVLTLVLGVYPQLVWGTLTKNEAKITAQAKPALPE